MPVSNSGYSGLAAKSWDLGRGDTTEWPDRSFFHDSIAEFGTPALDVGCSTGRLLLDFLNRGMDIDGVDASPDMIALCRAKADAMGLAPHLYTQRMEDLELPRTYRTIIVPSSSLQLLTNTDAARDAMRKFYAHLEPRGVLVAPLLL